MERIHLVESVSISNANITTLPLTESKMVESIDGTQYKAIGAYSVPISRYDSVNKNNRIYTRKLWENVIGNQRDIYDGAAGLLDHPTSEASVKDIFCVWHNLRLDEKDKLVLADMYLCGAKGRDAKDFLDAGGKLELSSSGYGNIGMDGKTVEESSYQIERPADWVFDASQSVFATNQDEIVTEKKENEEILNTNIVEKDDKEFDKMDKLNEKVGVLQLKQCESYVQDQYKQAEKEENLSEKKKIYNGIIEYCSDLPELSALSEKAEKGISAIEDSLYEAEKEAKKVPSLNEEKESLLQENVKLKEQNERMVSFIEEARDACNFLKEQAVSLEEKNKTLKSLYEQSEAEKNVLVSADEIIKTQEITEKKIKKLKDLLLASTEKVEGLESKLERSERMKRRLLLQLEAEKNGEEDEDEDEDDEEDEDKGEEKEEKKSSKKESFTRRSQKRIAEKTGLHESYVSDDVAQWYEDMLKIEEARENVLNHQDELLSSPNVSEAIRKYRLLNSTTNRKPLVETVEEDYSNEHFTQRSGGSSMDSIISRAKEFHRGNFV